MEDFAQVTQRWGKNTVSPKMSYQVPLELLIRILKSLFRDQFLGNVPQLGEFPHLDRSNIQFHSGKVR